MVHLKDIPILRALDLQWRRCSGIRIVLPVAATAEKQDDNKSTSI